MAKPQKRKESTVTRSIALPALILALGCWGVSHADSSEPSASAAPTFRSLEGMVVQPLSHDEMRQTTGKFVLDGSINLTALVERLSPAQRGQLTQILVAAQQRGIPLPSALSALIPAGTGTAAQGTEAQGIDQ